MKRLIQIIFLILFLLKCNTVDNSRLSSGDSRHRNNRDSVFLKYLGTGGLLIKWKNSVIMTAPFFSNPSLGSACLSQGAWCLFPFKPDYDHVREHLKKIDDIESVKAILVGHSHYDHLLDIPCVLNYIRSKNPKNDPAVYGSRSMDYLFRAIEKYKSWEKCIPEKPVSSIKIDGNDLSQNQKPGNWINIDKNIRFMAVKSNHAPHILGFDIMGKDRKLNKVPDMPVTPRDWVVGETYAFIIDLMSDDGVTVKFRIHYQDTPTNYPVGSVPDFRKKENKKKVDVLVVCMPTFNQVKKYPELIIKNTNPRYILIGHWEDFFRQWPPDGKYEYSVVPFVPYEKFIKTIPEKTVYYWPRPGAGYYFLPD